MQGANFDAFVVTSLLATLIFGPKYSPELVPIFWLFSGCLLGAVVALKNRKQASNLHALLFVAVAWFWAVGIAGSVAAIIAPRVGLSQQSLLFFSGALCAGIGDGWLELPSKVKRAALAIVGGFAPKRSDQ